MSDFTAYAIATVFAVAFAPWYVVIPLLFGLAWCFFSEMP